MNGFFVALPRSVTFFLGRSQVKLGYKDTLPTPLPLNPAHLHKPPQLKHSYTQYQQIFHRMFYALLGRILGMSQLETFFIPLERAITF